MLHLQTERTSLHFASKRLPTNCILTVLLPPFGKIRNGKWSFKNRTLTSTVITMASKIHWWMPKLSDKVEGEKGYFHSLKVSHPR